MKNFYKFALVALTAVVLSSAMSASSSAVFSVVKIPGISPNSPIAINNNGQVVVNTGTGDSSAVSVWTRQNGSESLGLTGNEGGAGINNSGNIVGAGAPSNSNTTQGFAWFPSSGAEWLGSLGGGMSAASGINSSNAIVGLSYTSQAYQHAFYWTRAEGMTDITPSLTSIGGGTAVSINSSNEVVGYFYPNGSLNTLGFTWTASGGLQSFGTAGTLGFGVNDEGTVVGQYILSTGWRHAFSYTQSGVMTDLGTLGGGESSALGINSAGWIVGTSYTTDQTNLPHGFLWTPTNGMVDLTTLAGISINQRVYSIQVNDYGVIALTSNQGGEVLIPKMTGTLSSSHNPSNLGQAVTFTVNITSIVGPPPDGETVQFVVSGNLLGTGTLKNGVAQFTTSAIPAGKHAVVADYPGDNNYLPAKYTALTQVVNQ